MKLFKIFTKLFFFINFIVATLLSAGSLCYGDDFDFSDQIDFKIFINDRFHLLSNFLDIGDGGFNKNRNYHILFVNPSISAKLAPHVRGVLELQGEFTLNIDSTDLSDDIEVRNAYLQMMFPFWDWVSISVGRQWLRTMDGMIYDDNAPAVKAYADLERGYGLPVKVRTFITEVTHDSPYFHFELKYDFSFLESLAFSYGWFNDKEDGVARIFNFLEKKSMFKSNGSIQWFGFSFNKFFFNFLLRLKVIYENGSITLKKKAKRSRKMGTRGYLVDLNFDYSFSDKVAGSLFFYLSSGDSRPEGGKLRTFFSIDPYIDKTNIFFNGGIDSMFSSDNIGINGVQLNGVMAPGIMFYYNPSEKISLKLTLAYLLTHRKRSGEGKTYGWETDFTGFYNFDDQWQIIMEFNFFKPGNYFRKLSEHRSSFSTETIIGVNYLF